MNKLMKIVFIPVPLIIYLLLHPWKDSNTFIIATMLMIFLGLAAMSDIHERIIPNEIVLISIIVSLIIQLFNFEKIKYQPINVFLPIILGITAGSGFLLLIDFTCKFIFRINNSLGMGDVKLFLPIGILLGPTYTYAILAFAILLAAFYVIVKKINKTNVKSIPFAPFVYISFLLLLPFWNI